MEDEERLIIIRASAALRGEIKKLQTYICHLTTYAETAHPLGVSADDCNDECLTAEAIRYAHSIRSDA